MYKETIIKYWLLRSVYLIQVLRGDARPVSAVLKGGGAEILEAYLVSS